MTKLPPFELPFYPKTSKIEVFKRYSSKENVPYHQLQQLMKQDPVEGKGAVAHFVMRDSRVKDNIALSKALDLAKQRNVPVVSVRMVCEENMKAHGLGVLQYNYQYKCARIVEEKLKSYGVNSFDVKASSRKEMVKSLVDMFKEKKIGTVFANMEYEVDELQMFIKLVKQCRKEGIQFSPVADTCVIEPGKIKKKDGTYYKMFKPWNQMWIDLVKSNKDCYKDNSVELNHKWTTLDVDEKYETGTNLGYTLSEEQEKAFKQYAFGEDEAEKALEQFVKSDLEQYDNGTRSRISDGANSRLSPYLSNGVISSRAVVRQVLNYEKSALAGEFLRQLSWRDFYKHIVAEYPYVCMGIGMKPDDDYEWINDEAEFNSWKNGTTGVPVIDAIMKELNNTGYISNRARMITSSYVVKDLLIDWRYGERYFCEQLIDSDFASNNGGWGFISSFGVNSQPWFRVLNPWTQSEKFGGEDLKEKWGVTASQSKDVHSERRTRALEWIKQSE